MNVAIIPFKEPPSLAGLAVNPPPFFFPMKRPGSDSLASSPPISVTGTRGGPITKAAGRFFGLDEYIAAAGIAADPGWPAVSHHRPLGRHAAPQRRNRRLPHDRAPCETGRHQNPHRQSFHACDRHHRLSEKWRLAGEGSGDGKPRRYAHPRTSMNRSADVASLDEYGKVGI
jgi:hypothetical protein